MLNLSSSLSLILRPTVSRSIYLGIKHPSGAYDQIFNYCQTVAGLLMWGALSDETTGLSFTMLLVLASEVIFGFESRGTRDHILRLRFETSYFVSSYDSQGYAGGIPTRVQSQSYVTTDGQSSSLSWNKAPMWDLRPDFHYCQTIAGLLIGGALSDERTGRVLFTFYMLLPECIYKVSVSPDSVKHLIKGFHFSYLW
jgi:hypothetical protein